MRFKKEKSIRKYVQNQQKSKNNVHLGNNKNNDNQMVRKLEISDFFGIEICLLILHLQVLQVHRYLVHFKVKQATSFIY